MTIWPSALVAGVRLLLLPGAEVSCQPLLVLVRVATAEWGLERSAWSAG